MFARIVMTSGTSVFAPFNELASKLSDARGFQIDRGKARPSDGLDPRDAVELWTQSVGNLSLPSSLDPTKVSAEYSLLHALREQHMLTSSPQVVLIRSDTPDGAAAAILARRLIEHEFGADVTIRKVEEVGVQDPQKLSRSLGDLLQEIGDALRAGEPTTTCFAPVGGYKVMTALGYMVGSLLGYPMSYLHEVGQRLHTIPAAPVQLDEAWVARVLPLLRRLRELRLTRELTDDEQKRLPEVSLLVSRIESDGDEAVELSPFGYYLIARDTPSALATHVSVAHEVWPADAAERRFAVGQIKSLIEKLRDPVGNQGVLRHELAFSQSRAQWSLYKGASNGQRVFRALYRHDSNGDTVRVAQIWLSHDAYEREARGALLLADPGSWQDISSDVHSSG